MKCKARGSEREVDLTRAEEMGELWSPTEETHIAALRRSYFGTSTEYLMKEAGC